MDYTLKKTLGTPVKITLKLTHERHLVERIVIHWGETDHLKGSVDHTKMSRLTDRIMTFTTEEALQKTLRDTLDYYADKHVLVDVYHHTAPDCYTLDTYDIDGNHHKRY